MGTTTWEPIMATGTDPNMDVPSSNTRILLHRTSTGHIPHFMRQIEVPCLGEFADRLQISGVGYYGDRALVLSADTVLVQADPPDWPVLRSYHKYLNQLGFGSREVIFVPSMGHGALMESIMDPRNKALLDRIRAQLAMGYQLRAFSSGGHFAKFKQQLGEYLPESLLTCDHPIMRQIDNKAGFREIAQELNQSSAVPGYVFCTTSEEVRAKLRSGLQMGQTFFMKCEDLEGGDGIMMVSPDTAEAEVSSYIDRYVDGVRRIIIDEAIFGEDVSVQWFLRPDGPVPLFFSRQYMNGSSHAGNVVSANEWEPLVGWGGDAAKTIVNRAWEQTRPFASHAWNNGGRGNLGFDLKLRGSDHRPFILEVNARFTAGTVVHAVRTQVPSGCAVAMRNVSIQEGRTWKDLLLALRADKQAYNRQKQKGVLIGLPRLVPGGKVCLFSVAGTVLESEVQMTSAMNLIGAE